MGVRYELTLVIGTLKVMASTGVFVFVVCALIRCIKNFPSPTSMILVFSTCRKNISSQFFDLNIENPLGRGTLAKFRPTLQQWGFIVGISAPMYFRVGSWPSPPPLPYPPFKILLSQMHHKSLVWMHNTWHESTEPRLFRRGRRSSRSIGGLSSFNDVDGQVPYI